MLSFEAGGGLEHETVLSKQMHFCSILDKIERKISDKLILNAAGAGG